MHDDEFIQQAAKAVDEIEHKFAQHLITANERSELLQDVLDYQRLEVVVQDLDRKQRIHKAYETLYELASNVFPILL